MANTRQNKKGKSAGSAKKGSAYPDKAGHKEMAGKRGKSSDGKGSPGTSRNSENDPVDLYKLDDEPDLEEDDEEDQDELSGL